MFRVEFSVHLTYSKGMTSFRREEELPFVPFIGLDVLDDVLGQFTLEHVAWHSGSRMFLCQRVSTLWLCCNRTQGIGRALVNACLASLKDAGILRCNLFVLDGSDDGKRFWSKGGWYDWPEIRLMSKDSKEADVSGATS
jgi:hypothetical protein